MDCQVIALSATITKPSQRMILENLLMTDVVISVSPAEENIQLVVMKQPNANARGNDACTQHNCIFQLLLEELKIKPDDCPITIVYCKSMQCAPLIADYSCSVMKVT